MNKRQIEECGSVCMRASVCRPALSVYVKFRASRPTKQPALEGFENNWVSMGAKK